MRRIILLASFLAFAVTSIAEPAAKIVPTQAIEVSTDVGSTGSMRGKATVSEKATISKKGVTFTTEIAQSGSFDYASFTVPADDLASLIAALDSAAAKVDEKYTKTAGKLTVSTVDVGDKRGIAITEDRNSFSQSHVVFDSDGATSLVALLKKAEGVKEWMKDRVGALDPKK